MRGQFNERAVLREDSIMRGLLGSSINGVKLILTAILLILNGVKLILTAILMILNGVKLILTAILCSKSPRYLFSQKTTRVPSLNSSCNPDSNDI